MCMCVYSQSLRSICFAVWLGNGVETDRSKTTMFYDRFCGASPVAQWVQNPPAMQEMHPDMGLIPGLGRSLGREYGNPLLYSCLENPLDRGAWWATVHGVTKSWTQLKWLSTVQHNIVDESPPPDAGDTGSIPGPGRSHKQWGGWPCAPKLLSPHA